MPSLSDKEKDVRSCLTIILDAARKMIKTVPSRSGTLKDIDDQLEELSKLLKDGSEQRIC